MENKERSMDNSSEETFDFICTTCDSKGKIVEAVRYCIECSGYCCQTCTDIHHTFPTLKGHNLLDASQGNQASNQPSSLPEFPTERCNLHTGKVIDMYCEEHNEVCCCTCVATNHKFCPKKNVHSIPDLIGTLFNLRDCNEIKSRLKTMLISTATPGKSEVNRLQALKDVKNLEIEKVLNFQKNLESIIRKAAEASRNEIESKYKELENELLQEELDVEGYEVSLKESDEKLKKAEGNRAQCFVCSKIAEKKMKEAGSRIAKQKERNNDNIQVTFTPDVSLMKTLNGLHGIGMVSVDTKKRTDQSKISGRKDLPNKKDDDLVFETFHHRSGKDFNCIYQSGMRFYLDDWESKEWQPFPKRWYNEGLLVTNTILNGDSTGQANSTKSENTASEGESTQWSQGSTQGRNREDRGGFLMHPTKGRIPTYIFYKKHNVHMYFDREIGSWVRMPVSWELHHNMIKALVDQVEEAIPTWRDRHDILSLLRACNYDPDDCIAIYRRLANDEWIKAP